MPLSPRSVPPRAHSLQEPKPKLPDSMMIRINTLEYMLTVDPLLLEALDRFLIFLKFVIELEPMLEESKADRSPPSPKR